MKEIKKVILCGLGAIGSIYATKITEYNNEILSILVDQNRLRSYKKNPLNFNGKEFDFQYITPQNNAFEADLVIIATKNNALLEVLNNIKNFVGTNTIILSLLNGLKSEDIIADYFGKDKILYSYYIGHTSTRIGRNVTQDGVYDTIFGEKDNTVLSDKVKRVKAFFDKVGINYKIPVDMEYSRWWKFLVNVGYNQASAVLRAPYSVFQKNKKINNIAVKLMQEAVDVAKAEGVKNTEKLVPEVLDVIKKMVPETKTSMLQDVEANRKTEVSVFAGYICELAQKHNIQTPYNSMFLELIEALDSVSK